MLMLMDGHVRRTEEWDAVAISMAEDQRQLQHELKEGMDAWLSIPVHSFGDPCLGQRDPRRVNRRWRKSRIIRFCLELYLDLLTSSRSLTRTIPDLALLLALLATISGPLLVQFVLRFEFIQIAYHTIN